jgi:periplasmic divalent cation tolerance protein
MEARQAQLIAAAWHSPHTRIHFAARQKMRYTAGKIPMVCLEGSTGMHESPNTPYMVVLVATGSIEEARAIARASVERKLAACAQVLPIHSIYEWEGAVQEDSEQLLLLKTHRDAYPALAACVLEIHSYDVPEMIVLPVVAGHEPYLQWLTGVVGQAGAA